MTENETKEVVKKLRNKAELFKNSGFAVDGIVKSFEDSANAIEMLSKEIQQCREYKEIFENHFSEEALKLLSDKEEFGKWLERGRWIAKKCDEINRELEQYRAIGTVEQLEWCKDASHWKELFKEKLEKYEAIGTIEEFKALKEKDTPYKPQEYEDRYYACKCDNILLPKWRKYPTELMPKSEGLPHCMACGQKIDWE